jgi:hypothetical protein
MDKETMMITREETKVKAETMPMRVIATNVTSKAKAETIPMSVIATKVKAETMPIHVIATKVKTETIPTRVIATNATNKVKVETIPVNVIATIVKTETETITVNVIETKVKTETMSVIATTTEDASRVTNTLLTSKSMRPTHVQSMSLDHSTSGVRATRAIGCILKTLVLLSPISSTRAANPTAMEPFRANNSYVCSTRPLLPILPNTLRPARAVARVNRCSNRIFTICF